MYIFIYIFIYIYIYVYIRKYIRLYMYIHHVTTGKIIEKRVDRCIVSVSVSVSGIDGLFL
jgi:hypothetical protein